MSKYLKIALFTWLTVTVSVSCSKRKTYADYLEDERKRIASYIDANHIQVEHSKPEGDGKWVTEDGRDIYYLSSSGLYYHQIEQGDGLIAPVVGYEASVRYIGTTLSGTVVYDYSPKYQANPASFGISSNPKGKTYGIGFQEAVKYMRAGGRCKIIVPFNLGNGGNYTFSGTVFSDADNYTPMVYEIWLIHVE